MRPRRIVLLIALCALGLGVWIATRGSERGSAATRIEGAPESGAAPAPLLEFANNAGAAADAARSGTEAPAARVAVESGATGRLTVLVVSSEDATPEPGIAVFLRVPEGSPEVVLDPQATTGLSDPAGRVELFPPAGIALDLLGSGFDGEGIDVHEERGLDAFAAGEEREVTIEITRPPRYVFHGRLVDRDDGSPVAGGVIRRRVEQQFRGLTLAECPGPSAGDGSFRLALRAWRRPSIRVDAPGYSPVFVELGQDHDTPASALAIKLRASAGLLVTVLDPLGEPVENAGVLLSTQAYRLNHQRDVFDFFGGVQPRWTGLTDEQGRARIPELPSEVPLAVFANNTPLPFRWIEPLVLEAGEQRELELHLDAGQRVAGTVADDSGEPIVSHNVWLFSVASGVHPPFDTGIRPFAETEPDDAGRFVFDGVPTGRWYVLLEPLRGSRAVDLEHAFAPAHVEFEVASGRDVSGLRVVAHRGLMIHGVVLDAAGQPAPDVQVFALAEDQLQTTNLDTEDDGSFVVGPLVPGSHRLWASSPRATDAGSLPVDVQAGSSGVVLQMRPGGTIRGFVVDAGSGSFEDAKILIRSTDLTKWEVGFGFGSRTLRTPDFELTGLPAGTWSLCVVNRAGEFGLAPLVALGTAETVEAVEIHLEPGGRVRVQLGPTLEPAGGAHGRYEIWAAGRLVAGAGLRAGASALKTVPAGRVTVLAWFPGDVLLGEKSATVSAGEEIEVVFEPGR